MGGIITAKPGKLEKADTRVAGSVSAGVVGLFQPPATGRSSVWPPFADGGVVLEAFQEFTNREVERWVDEVRNQFCSWNKDEASLMESWMGHDQGFGLQDFLSV